MKKADLTWNLNHLYKSDTDKNINKDRKSSERNIYQFVKKYRKNKKHLKSPQALLHALKEYEDLTFKNGISEKEGYYLSLRKSQNTSDPQILSTINKYTQFETKLQNEIEFFMIEIAKIDPKLHKKFLSYKGLSNYKHFLERVFESAKYTLTESEEKILNITSKTSLSNWTSMLSEFLSNEQGEYIDEKGKKKVANFSQLFSNLESRNKRARDSSAKSINSILKKNLAVATKEVNSILEYKRETDNLRGYTRPDQARHFSDDIDSEVVDALIKTVSKYFTISQRFYKLKAKLMKKKKLAYHERIVEIGDFNRRYTFKQAQELVLNVYASLDDELGGLVKEFFEQGRIDVFPRKGKRSGAFCAYASPILPTYILLNHADTLNDVLTLAHELGHGVNDELMRVQTPLNFGTPLSTAEVASTFFEDFVFENVLEGLNEKDRFSLMMHKLSSDISTIHRQVAGYLFEKELHTDFQQKGYLSESEIGEIFRRNMNAYMGEAVSQDEGSQNWWVYWSHFRTFFYVYSYASGLLISKSLQEMVKKDPKKISKVKDFLKKGSSASPKEIFLEMGIDISKPSFWKKGLKKMEEDMLQLENLAKKLGKI